MEKCTPDNNFLAPNVCRQLIIEDTGALTAILNIAQNSRKGLREKTAALVWQYLKKFQPDRKPDDSFIYTVLKGKQARISIRNMQKLIKKYADKVSDHYASRHLKPNCLLPL